MKTKCFANIFMIAFFLLLTKAEAKTVVVNSLNPTGNYGALAGAHFDANGNFISRDS